MSKRWVPNSTAQSDVRDEAARAAGRGRWALRLDKEKWK